MSHDFLEDSNICGQTVLRLVSRGSAIITELLRLSEHVPPVFFPDQQLAAFYSPVLRDFSYLKEEDEFEKRIQSNQKFLDLDEEFRDNYKDILERFYRLFEAIYKYISDFLKFLSDIEEGVFIQQTYESILISLDGKQLMAEALYLYGCMLLLMDLKIDGIVRERILISYLRYNSSSGESFDEVCKLCRATGFSKIYGKYPGQHPSGYPEEYFSRIPIPNHVLSMIIGRLRSDDIYQMAFNYPAPEHRSTALSTQAAMLYVMLFFQPDTLKNQAATMREIVDKHFPDNWIMNWYMGFHVDLSVVWYPYKAAGKAIDNILTTDNVKCQSTLYSQKLQKLLNEVPELLREGLLTEDYVLDTINSRLLPVIRDCNVTLRWCILHSTCGNKKMKEMIMSGIKYEDILKLLLGTAQLEYTLKEMFQYLLEQKETKWEAAKEAAIGKMDDISEYFAGEQVLASLQKEEQLQQYFSDTAENIEDLDCQDSTIAGRKITTLIAALEEVEQFHQVYENLQVRQYLMDTRDLLRKMLRYVNIKEKVPITICTVGDLSYAWELIGTFVPAMQKRIKRQPSLVIQLRSTFLKLATMLELPLTRIAQANSPDLASVSQFHSEALVKFVGRVLDIIPESMFEVLSQIIDIQTHKLQECPTKIPRQSLVEYAQLDARYELSKATFQVSKFTEGILAMEKTLVGVIQVDPHKMLEGGIRKAVVKRITKILHETLNFPVSRSKVDFGAQLLKLEHQLNKMKSSFEYIQDYICMYGLKIWQEEFSRIINYNVEQECNQFLKKKIFEWDSQYQSDRVPIPRFQPTDDQSVNFMGRIVRELQHQTHPKNSTYVDQLVSWFDFTGKEVVGLRTISLIRESMGTSGLNGIDKLLCFMIVRRIQDFVTYLDRNLLSVFAADLEKMSKDISPSETLPRTARQWYEGPMMARLSKSFFPALLDPIITIGANQVLRRHVASELRLTCKLDSSILFGALNATNNALLADVRAHYRDPEMYPYPSKDNPILAELTNYLEASGVTHPFSKVYNSGPPQDQLPVVLFLFVINYLRKFAYDPSIDTLTCKAKGESLDGVPFVVGIITILKQYHSDHKECFVGLLTQYVRVLMNESSNADMKTLPLEVVNGLHFLEMFCKLAPLSRKVVENQLPPYLFSRFKKS